MKRPVDGPKIAKRTHPRGPFVLHVPHASRAIPASLRNQFALSDVKLEAELLAMTDAHTDRLFTRSTRASREVLI